MNGKGGEALYPSALLLLYPLFKLNTLNYYCAKFNRILNVVDYHHKNGDRSDNKESNCQAYALIVMQIWLEEDNIIEDSLQDWI